jgi:hypothetical protein
LSFEGFLEAFALEKEGALVVVGFAAEIAPRFTGTSSSENTRAEPLSGR